MRKRSSIWDRTGAKQSGFDQSCGSRLPSATILYFALIGTPFLSNFMVDIAIVGSILPTVSLILLYSDSDMMSQAGRSWSPSYSSRYAASHICLSFLLSFVCCMSVGASRVDRPFADTCLACICAAMMLDNAAARRACMISENRVFHPWNSFLFCIMLLATFSKFSSVIAFAGRLPLGRPGRNSHLLAGVRHKVPCLG